MAHFIAEYSGNLENEVDWQPLFAKLHGQLAATGVFPIGGLRSRAIRLDHYRMADGAEDDAFVHMTFKMGHGRDEATRKEAGELIFSLVCEHFAELFERRYLALSFELVELEPVLNFKKNNVHQRFKK
jgi:5-carboxymethyl-2-hydroxymuconate isomerase